VKSGPPRNWQAAEKISAACTLSYLPLARGRRLRKGAIFIQGATPIDAGCNSDRANHTCLRTRFSATLLGNLFQVGFVKLSRAEAERYQPRAFWDIQIGMAINPQVRKAIPDGRTLR
jgi:hypothetical protein